MKLRTLNNLDQPRLNSFFEMQGFDYELPDIRTMVAAQGIEAEGQIVQAVLARPTVELYFLADPDWRTPAWRLEALRKIHEAMRVDLQGKGFTDAHVFLPPEKSDSFGKRLMSDFHWTQPLWTPLTRSTEAKG